MNTITLSIIGAGKLGQTLGRLLSVSPPVRIHQVMNRSLASARKAIEFIGQGAPAGDWGELTPVGAILVATPDDAIASCAKALASSPAIHEGTLIFHCSGALGSEVLTAAQARGALPASVHPAMSFANPETAAQGFSGVTCGAEGNPEALSKLRPWFEACGARWFELPAGAKLLYHAGAVMACNYVTTLLEAAFQCYEQAGMPRKTAAEVMAPLLAETVANCLSLGPANTLTGPIARGDAALVARQAEALAERVPRLAALYTSLGLATLDLARQQGRVPDQALDRLAQALKATDNPRPGGESRNSRTADRRTGGH
jgi:predicted short-subunit dehydrogenase-like oxidoreductase (DUF2520 family)